MQKAQWHFQADTCPLNAIYILERRGKTVVEPVINSLTPAAAMLDIAPHSYAKYVMEAADKQREFHSLGQLVQRVPTRVVQRSDDISQLSQIGKAILADFNKITHG